MYAAVGILIALALAAVYIDQSAVARVEAGRLAEAAEIQQASLDHVRRISEERKATLEGHVARLRADSTRLRSEAQRLRERAVPRPSPRPDGFCQPGCKLRW